MPARRGAAALGLALVLAGGFPAVAAAEDTVAFSIRDARITESSGLARDVAGGLYWTMDDSGSSGVVYGLEPDGKVRGTLNFRAPVRDVEAVALHDNRLYAGDIGDNGANRAMVTVYYFLNPRANGLTVTYNAFDFRYPDGAHDAETLLVDGSGRLYVVTKSLTGGAVYAAPTNPSRTQVNVLRRVADAPALVTDGVFLPGDDRIALLTYTGVVVLDAQGYAQVGRAGIPAGHQSESIAVSLDGSTLLVGSEGRNSPVYAVPLPGAASASATPSGTPSPTTTAEPGSDSGDEDAEPAAAGGSRRTGTYLAVGLAGLLALVAGVVVAAIRKP